MESSRRRKYIPKRYWPVPGRAWNLPEIQRCRESPARFKTIHAGRRSYKTEIFGRRWIVAKALATPDTSWFYGAPTYKQAKLIAWDGIKGLIPRLFVLSISESELVIRLKTGSQIYLVGFDRPERFEGKEQWHGGVLDEFAHMDSSVWDKSVEPAIRDTKGTVHFIGKPSGINHYAALSEYARNGDDPDWDDFCWFSSAVMDEIEVAKAKERLDIRTFRQEYEGSFESYGGRATPYYDREVHEKEMSLDRHRPITVWCDFNIDPCIWLIGQDTDDMSYVHDQIVGRNTDTYKMTVALKDKLEKMYGEYARSHKLEFFGDHTASKRRDVLSITSSWKVIRDEFFHWNTEFFLKSNPRVMDRMNAVNSRMRSASGKVRFAHHPQVTELRKDCQQVEIDTYLNAKGSDPDRTHALDAFGYGANYKYPAGGLEEGVQYS